ncbi:MULTISPECIES: non-ribosomal peptide synthetase family protein [unclassified Calothrix]|uniref:non-ribosomal peptide synthetase family protein n=1 Tax=unclassified Calothrix TaxID=2619626 RepID=UPI001F5577D6|nr:MULTISPECIES: amino acid adenylation domain-containing protein [unclassified Calothrix]
MLRNVKNVSIHQLVELQVSQTPDAVAVVFENEQLTYQQLNQKANQLAHYLRTLGVKPETVVGVCIERSLDMVIALLGILKAGGAYLPIDSSYPVDRLRFMLENAQVPILITESNLINSLPKYQTNIICLDTDGELISKYSITNPVGETIPDHLAYVIHTSGSTGTPKAVSMTHCSLVNLLEWQFQTSVVSLGAKTLQFAPISFDVSFQEIFSTLGTGGILVMISEKTRRDTICLLQLLDEARIERLFVPFVALQHLADVAASRGIAPASLREVITAGEQLRITEAICNWFNQLPNCTLYNHYGPSETHVVTAYKLVGAPKDWQLLPPIGRPISNTQIYLLDSQLKAVPVGATGELYIAGISLARGYLNDPNLTAQKFINNPFSANPDERLYKTGDLARYLPDGNIEYLGRIDQQVKIRGFRIEPGEVEAVLEKHPYVQESLVVAREATTGNKRLVAYIVANGLASPERLSVPFSRELRQFLQKQLPDYMLPSAFVILEKLPLTPNGKVDRRALPLPQWNRTQEGSYVAPVTVVEIQIAQIWSRLLGIEEVGVYDNFCELGGYSFLAVKLIVQVNEAFQLNIPLDKFLQNPTIAGLIEIINAIRLDKNALEPLNDMETELSLDPAIYPENILADPIPQFFLTGATGFLGTFLLHELLYKTRADIHCLVRSSSIEEGQAKIKSSLQRYHLWEESLSSRIIPVLGDLSQPKMGIEPAKFFRLTEKIDMIYHCGAWVNLIYPYPVLKTVNVLGTQEVLRLASQTKIKPVHFISTVDVLSSGNSNHITKSYREQDFISPSKFYSSGYAQSKYIAEKLVMMAYSRGLPVSIYRPSNIMGHSKTGITQTNSLVTKIIKGCIQMGIAPQIDAVLNLVPVDYVSQMIVSLSQQQNIYGQAFNIVNRRPIEWINLVDAISRMGYPLQLVSYKQWYKKLLIISSQSSENILAPIADIFKNHNFFELLGAFDFDFGNNISTDINRSIIDFPINDDLLSVYFSYFIKSNFIHAPVPHDLLRDLRVPEPR